MRPEHTDLTLFIEAVAFAAEKHRTQRRKDAEASPYINHPIALAQVLASEGGVLDSEVLCAAVLHDTVEDTATTPEELAERFGPAIAAIVMEVTDDKSLPKSDRKRLQIEHAAHLSPKAKLVKLADKICNLRDILASPPADWSSERKQEYFDWAKAVVDGLRGTQAGLEGLFDQVYNSRLNNTELPFGIDLNKIAECFYNNILSGISHDKKQKYIETINDVFFDSWEHELHRVIYNQLWLKNINGEISNLQAGLKRNDWFKTSKKPDISFEFKDKKIIIEIKTGSNSMPKQINETIDKHNDLLNGEFWIICLRKTEMFSELANKYNNIYKNSIDYLNNTNIVAFMAFSNS